MWRHITVGNIGFLMLVFLLPWIDVRCKDKQGDASFSLFTQSGLQSTYGDFSVSEMLNDEGMGGKKAGGPGLKKDNDMAAAPFMIVYAVALVGGLIFALAMPRGKSWVLAVGACAGLAIATLALQSVVGFPIQTDVDKDIEDKKKQPAAPPVPKNQIQFGPNMNMQEPEIFIRYAIGFYLAWLGTLALPVGIAMAMKENLPVQRSPAGDDDDVETSEDNPSL